MHNISIINNTIRDCNYINFAGAAFQLHGDGDNAIGGSSKITVQGLTIENTTASKLYIGASEGVVLGNVTFKSVYQSKYTLAQQWPGSVATFQNVSFASTAGVRCVEGGVGAEGVNMSNLQGITTGIDGNVLGPC